MANSTNPRVRRFYQLLRLQCTAESQQKDYYNGVPTYPKGMTTYSNAFGEPRPRVAKEANLTSKDLLCWNYKEYPDKDKHLATADNTG